MEPETEEEATNVINFTVALGGDGEAYTGAIAIHRNWAIASDERRVLNFFAQRAPHLQRLTTPELLKYWADTAHPEPETLRLALELVANEGSYTISPRHSCFAWWQASCESDEVEGPS